MPPLLPPEAQRMSGRHSRPRNGDYVWLRGDSVNEYGVPDQCQYRTRTVGVVFRVDHEDRQALVRFFYHRWADPIEPEFDWIAFDAFSGNWNEKTEGYHIHESELSM